MLKFINLVKIPIYKKNNSKEVKHYNNQKYRTCLAEIVSKQNYMFIILKLIGPQ